jgi:hypothetical protein
MRPMTTEPSTIPGTSVALPGGGSAHQVLAGDVAAPLSGVDQPAEAFGGLAVGGAAGLGVMLHPIGVGR